MISELKKHLQHGSAIVTFVKKNGEMREMECTLAPYLLPETSGTSSRPSNNEVTVVFDLEASAWRSFRNDSVVEIDLI